MQTSWSPIALCSSAATTDESTPPEAADHLAVADLLADAADGCSTKLPIVQVPEQLADLVEEVVEDLLAARRVRDLGVELHAVERPRLVRAAA
jgi:hypothetical protein